MVFTGFVFASMVISFVTMSFLPLLLNSTLISPFSPGAIGSFGHSGIVHPQLAEAFDMIRSLVPVFVNRNVCSTTSPSVIVPKSQIFLSKLITGSLLVFSSVSMAPASNFCVLLAFWFQAAIDTEINNMYMIFVMNV